MCTERVTVKPAFLGSSQVPYMLREKASLYASFPLLIGKEMGTAGGAPIGLLCIQGLSKTGQKTIPWDLGSCERVLQDTILPSCRTVRLGGSRTPAKGMFPDVMLSNADPP